jgi:sugar lactone lactonase YvrE
VWVTDGYGESYVHRYDKTGDYQGSINGEEGEAGPFNSPHGLAVDGEGNLYIAEWMVGGRITKLAMA